MSDWLDEYLLALKERDKKEKAQADLYQAYTRLADRTANATVSPLDVNLIEHKDLSKKPSSERSSGVKKAPKEATSLDSSDQLRKDLEESQQNRAALQAQLKSLNEETEKIRLQSATDCKRINDLVSERASLSVKMRDRDEELRDKKKLLENLHDETVSLTLQLNMAEEQSQKLERENKELVDRWMTRMGEEAETLNKVSKFS